MCKVLRFSVLRFVTVRQQRLRCNSNLGPTLLVYGLGRNLDSDLYPSAACSTELLFFEIFHLAEGLVLYVTIVTETW
jgi:hypothetical protein